MVVTAVIADHVETAIEAARIATDMEELNNEIGRPLVHHVLALYSDCFP